LRTERDGREVIDSYAADFDWNSSFEGHERSLVVKGLFTYSEIHIGRGSDVSMSADRQSCCERIANTKTIQLARRFDGCITYLRRRELKHLFEIHTIHVATGNLST
jgi:hypothetical protein